MAVGNTGEDDWDSGNARIQAPADGVNVLSVGACDSMNGPWKRAGYSSIGPGRSPGIVKPEIVVFGGSDSTPLALKALLIHHGDCAGFHAREVGWGRVPHEIEDLVTCPEGAVHVLYQGELEAGRYRRAKIPVPSTGLTGMVTISATLCYATQTDPQDLNRTGNLGGRLV